MRVRYNFSNNFYKSSLPCSKKSDIILRSDLHSRNDETWNSHLIWMSNICLYLATDMLLCTDIGNLCIPACYWQPSTPEASTVWERMHQTALSMTVPQLEMLLHSLQFQCHSSGHNVYSRQWVWVRIKLWRHKQMTCPTVMKKLVSQSIPLNAKWYWIKQTLWSREANSH
jgi:hypothetical protein